MARLIDDGDLRKHIEERLAVDPPPPPARQLVPPASLWRWVPFVLVIAASLTVVQLGTAAIDHLTAPRIDEPCQTHRDCGDGEFCMQHLRVDARFCSRACSDRSCPDGMRCGDISQIDEANRGVGAAGPAAASSACIRDR